MADPATGLSATTILAGLSPFAVAIVGWWQSRHKVSKDELAEYRKELRGDLDVTRGEVRALRAQVDRLRDKMVLVRAWLITTGARLDALRLHTEDKPDAVRIIDQIEGDMRVLAGDLEERTDPDASSLLTWPPARPETMPTEPLDATAIAAAAAKDKP